MNGQSVETMLIISPNDAHLFHPSCLKNQKAESRFTIHLPFAWYSCCLSHGRTDAGGDLLKFFGAQFKLGFAEVDVVH